MRNADGVFEGFIVGDIVKVNLVWSSFYDSVWSTVDGLELFIAVWVIECRSTPETYISFFQWGRIGRRCLVVVAKHGEVMLIDCSHGLLLGVLHVDCELM